MSEGVFLGKSPSRGFPTRSLFRTHHEDIQNHHTFPQLVLHNHDIENKTEHDAMMIFLSIIGIHVKNRKRSILNV